MAKKKEEETKVEETKAEKKPAKKKSTAKKKESAGEKKPAAKKSAAKKTTKKEAKATEPEVKEEPSAISHEPSAKLVRAKIGFMRQTARKVRRCANLLRKMTAGDAVNQLSFSPYAAAKPLKKLIESAMANATNNFSIENPEQLKISQLLVDDGVVYKRWQAVSKGRAHSIKKRTAQVRLVLSEMTPAEYAAHVWENSPRNKRKDKVA